MSIFKKKIISDQSEVNKKHDALEFEKLSSLIELAQMLNQQNDFQEVLRVVAQKAAGLLNADTSMIMMINPQTRQTVKTIQRQGHEVNQDQFRSVHTHVSGWIIKNKLSFISTDIKTDARFKKNLFKDSPINSIIGVPLITEGIILGTILLLNLKNELISIEADLSYLEKFANIVAPFLRNVQCVQQYFEKPIPQTTLFAKYNALGLLGKSQKFSELLQAIEAAARCDVRVLLEGPSGSGKELIARAIHQFSARSDKPFVAIDCGAIPPNLLESELFGHVKGAFTGATTDRNGLLEAADQGTLFMDEIANLPLEMQAKFMRVLQEGEIRPIGSNKTRSIDVRFISASSSPLRKLVDSQQFREDLFFRLHVYPIQVPHLNDRPEDIPLLANHFLQEFSSQQNKPVELFHEEITDFMQLRHWSGNIRELENFVERLVTHASLHTKIIDKAILPQELKKEFKKFHKSLPEQFTPKSLNEQLSVFEEQIIRDSLIGNNWNQSKTARLLKISEQTLRYKMGKLGIVR
ncbi:sigma-54-dependent Fis family transcriptional regulator [candidate division KSB1 bacterium]|nr:sigma-54-dependent Fis family transcriptional regulator [candidate division KSB1 bacterium]